MCYVAVTAGVPEGWLVVLVKEIRKGSVGRLQALIPGKRDHVVHSGCCARNGTALR